MVLRRARRRLKKSLEKNFTTLTKWLNEHHCRFGDGDVR